MHIVFTRGYVFLYLFLIVSTTKAQQKANFIDDTFKRYDFKKTTTKDSLLKYSYEDLTKLYKIHKKDTSKSLLYTRAYLKKAKSEKNKKELLNGYLLNQLASKNEMLSYGDSLIRISKILKIKQYEARGYYYKGVYYYNKRKFKLSLDQQLIADSIIAPLKDTKLVFMVSYNIGLLKDIFGQHEEALKVFKKNFNRLTAKKSQINDSYFRHLFALTNSYRKNKALDSAIYYCKLGITKSKNYKKNTKYYYDFLLTKGILDLDLGNIIIAEKNIIEAQKYYGTTKIDQPNLSFCYYYQSLIDSINNKEKQSINGLKKVDSTYLKYGFLHPELKGAYEKLISHYKSKKDVNTQLIYVERLLEINDLLHNDYRYVSKNISNNYETPKLLKRKEELINSLSNKNKKLYLTFIPIILIISFLVAINIRKKRIYKRRLDQILQDPPIQVGKKPSPTTTKIELNISEELRANIITGLEQFIDQENFIKKDITVGNLAKQIGTNAKYLAAIIKERYDKSFVRFINDLRIEYAIKHLKTDPKFRLYTIQGIAELSGFGHTESFTRAFVKKTGIKASYFLKNLN